MSHLFLLYFYAKEYKLQTQEVRHGTYGQSSL